MNLFFSRTRYKVEGLNLNRLTKAIVSEGIDLFDYAKPNNRTLYFTVNNNVRKKLIAICESLCYNLSVEAQFGFEAWFSHARKRFGLLFGVAALIAVTVLVNAFIWTIEVSGTERVLKSEVIKALEQQGIKSGILRKKIDADSVRFLLETGFEDISAVYVSVKGTRLYVKIDETLFKDEDVDFVGEVLAPSDGRVDSIVAFSGTPLVKAGDLVKKGQPLIADYEDRLLDDGVTVERIFKRAVGSVEMTVWYTHTETFLEKSIAYQRTGNTATQSRLSLLERRFAKRGGNPFSLFESEARQRIMFKNNLLPIKRITTVFYELERVEIVRDFASAEAALKSEALIAARLKAVDKEVYEEYTYAEEVAGVWRVTAVVATKFTVGG